MSEERVKLTPIEATAITHLLDEYTIDEMLDNQARTNGYWGGQFRTELREIRVSKLAKALYLGFVAIDEKGEECWTSHPWKRELEKEANHE